MSASAETLLERIDALAELVKAGGLPARRWMSLGEAALYCGFVDTKKPDNRHRAFKDFLTSEEIRYKQGSRRGKFEMLFDVLDLDLAMNRGKRPFAA